MKAAWLKIYDGNLTDEEICNKIIKFRFGDAHTAHDEYI